jgi:hypothetical protein
LDEPIADDGLHLRIVGRSVDGPDVDLPGAEVRRERPGARWRPAGLAALAVADERGQVDLTASDLQPDEHLAVDKAGYVSRSLRVADLPRGAVAVVTIERGAVFRAAFVDPSGGPVAGVAIVRSKSPIQTERVMGDLRGLVPGGDPERAVYHAISDERGEVEVVGLANGRYFSSPSRRGMFVVGGTEGFVHLPMQGIHSYVMGSVYVAAVEVRGDEVVVHNAQWVTAPVPQGVGQLLVAEIEAEFRVRYPGALLAVGVPSLSRQRAGKRLPLELAVYGRTSGGQGFPVEFQAYDAVQLQHIHLGVLPGVVAASARCEVTTPSGASVAGPVVLLSGAEPKLVHRISRVVDGDGRSAVLLPAGNYDVYPLTPFVDFVEAGQQVSLAPGQEVAVRGTSRFDVASVVPVIRTSDEDIVMICALTVKDVETGLQFERDTFVRRDRVVVPVGRAVEIGVRLPGAGSTNVRVRWSRADIERAGGAMDVILPAN